MREIGIYDHTGQVVRRIHADDERGGSVVIQTTENVGAVLEEVRRIRHQNEALGTSKEWRHVAELPVTVVEKAMREGWFHDQRAMRRFIMDPDNRGFRVHDKGF